MTKKIILAIIIISVLVGVFYYLISTKEELEFTLVEVSRGNVFQEVSETGQVKKGEKINLGFKNSGRIEEIYVEVSEEVEKGDVLAKLETKGLEIQLQEARSDLKAYEAKLNKLLAGASSEEIKAAETAVSNAETSLENARQDLKNVKAGAEEDLDQDYEDALSVLDDCYLKAYNVQNVVDSIQRNYFIKNDQEGIKVKENKYKIRTSVSEIKSYLDQARDNSEKEYTDLALSQTSNELSEIYNSLKIIREVCEELNYRDVVSSTDKASLDTHKTNINTSLTDISDSQQAISSTKLTNESNIDTAEAKVSTAQGSLETAQAGLSLITAPAQEADIDLSEAQITKAQTQIQFLENQLQESYLTSPVEGQVIKLNKRIGEMVSSALGEGIIVLLPTAPFEIETNIYEEDVVKLDIGNPVEILLVAFPDQVFEGRLISIDPSEKLIEGVVHYVVKISFEELPENIKPGMTADLVIKTASKEDVLIIPEDAIQEKDGKTTVQVLKHGMVEEREIEIGLRGSDGMTEVLSGILEGEEIILQ